MPLLSGKKSIVCALYSPTISAFCGWLGFRSTPLPVWRQCTISHRDAGEQSFTADAVPVLQTKAALCLPGLCSTELLQPSPLPLLGMGFGAQGDGEEWRRLSQAHNRALIVPSWKPAQWGPTCAPLPATGVVPLAASAPWQAPSLCWDISSLINPG